LKQNSEWLGPTRRSSLTMVDPPWQVTAAVVGGDAIVSIGHRGGADPHR
jgi:hypothetical protein